MVNVFAGPEGAMPAGGRWCDEQRPGADFVFHRDAKPILGTLDHWACDACGESTAVAKG